ncbi:MAG TPA: hypothetical protein VKV22_05380 [Rhodanobacteraceae bacterium]|nr:hypothetical protein [Rhodanobacteraceae bacterium]
MHTRNLALLAALAMAGGAVTAFAPTASAQVSLDISVGRPPPPPRFERPPPPRPGYVWAPGYWNWNGGSYVWVRGSWHRDRPGYIYYGPRWVHRGNRWVYHQPYWGRNPHWRGRRDYDRHGH